MDFKNKFSYRELENEGFRKAYYCGIPIYIKDHESDEPLAVGRNWFYDILFESLCWININIRGDEGFIFKIPLTDEEIEEYKKQQ